MGTASPRREGGRHSPRRRHHGRAHPAPEHARFPGSVQTGAGCDHRGPGTGSRRRWDLPLATSRSTTSLNWRPKNASATSRPPSSSKAAINASKAVLFIEGVIPVPAPVIAPPTRRCSPNSRASKATDCAPSPTTCFAASVSQALVAPGRASKRRAAHTPWMRSPSHASTSLLSAPTLECVRARTSHPASANS